MSLRQFLSVSLKGYKTFVVFCACTLIIAVATISTSPKKWDVICIVAPPVRMAPHLDTSLNLALRLRAPATLQKVIDRLRSQDGIDISYAELKKSLRVNSVGDNVEMHIEVQSGDAGVKISHRLIQEINNQEKEYLALLIESEEAVGERISNKNKKDTIVDRSKINSIDLNNSYFKELEHINVSARSFFLVEPNYDPRSTSPNVSLLISSALIIGIMFGLIKLFFYDRQSFDD